MLKNHLKFFFHEESKELEEMKQLAQITDILVNLTRFYHKLKTRCCQLMQDLQMALKIDFNQI